MKLSSLPKVAINSPCCLSSMPSVTSWRSYSSGLSNRIVFPYRIERFCLYWFKSNADRIKWNFWCLIRFDSIWTARWTRRTVNCDSRKWRIHLTSSQKRFSDIFASMVDNPFYKIGQLPNGQFFFMKTGAVFVLNWMKIESNWKVFAPG
jgi:hypothetical protein